MEKAVIVPILLRVHKVYLLRSFEKAKREMLPAKIGVLPQIVALKMGGRGRTLTFSCCNVSRDPKERPICDALLGHPFVAVLEDQGNQAASR